VRAAYGASKHRNIAGISSISVAIAAHNGVIKKTAGKHIA